MNLLRCLILLVSSSCLFNAVGLNAQKPGNPYGYLKGYGRTIRGNDFTYHSPQPDATISMLVRSIEKRLFIEWETESVPRDFREKEAKFIFLAAIDVNDENPHSWDIFINEKKEFVISSPENSESRIYNWKGPGGCLLEFRVTMTDQHGDQHGYMILTAPAGMFEKGKPLRIRAEGESANSQTWFMVFKYGLEPRLNLIEEQAVLRERSGNFQQVRIEYVYLGDPARAVIASGDIITPAALSFGYNTIRAKLPVVSSPESFPVSVSLLRGRQLLAVKEFTLHPVIPRTIYLLHHSHVDIGYTHVQDEVKQIQWKNLETAVKLASESSDFPEGSKFTWNTEVMWPLESYLREQPPDKAAVLKEAVSRGWIGLDAFYANELTELCTTEELIRLTSAARSVAAECGVKPLSAMITDIPGWSWGIVPVLARSGVRYLSLGTNAGHRIGSIISDWGDRPFYWVSPSGEEKILCWIHQKAYSLFHTGLSYKELKYRLDEGKIFGYMNELRDRNYPYGIVTLRYNIGSDNGPADPTLSQAVREWNEKYVTPSVRISTVAGAFSEFEKLYGDRIPSVSGAFTGYWEDGAASSALETAMTRMASANLNTASVLSVLNPENPYQADAFDEAWRDVLLYNEHTWGSWNSISEPLSPFTLKQWENKRQFALDALKKSRDLTGAASGKKEPDSNHGFSRIEVINTHSWPVTDMVTITGGMNIKGNIIRDIKGTRIISQRLGNGDLVFVAEEIPPFGSRIYTFETGDEQVSSPATKKDCIENDLFILKPDPRSGSVQSLFYKKCNIELADTTDIPGLNTYYYISGRSPAERFTAGKAITEIVENGPVTSIIKTTATGKGSRSITNFYQIAAGLEKAMITTIIDKENILTPEGVHLAFPFNIPGGIMRLDLAFGMYRPESDQVMASCKNYLTPERWVDISNQDHGVTWVTKDAPLIEIGDITTDATAYGWISSLKPSRTLYSYVMNNYWETNYKASQDGAVSFRYTVHPHGMFVPSDAEKISIQECEPLVIVPVDESRKEKASLIKVKNQSIIVTSLVPVSNGYLIRLLNAGGHPSEIDIEWNDEPEEVWFCDPDGNKTDMFVNGTTIPAWGLRTLRVRR